MTRPGTAARISFDLTDVNEVVYGLSFDILIDVPVFDIFQITNQCRTDPTLTTHQLSVTLAFDNVPAGRRRFRFVLFDALGGGHRLRGGPLVSCVLPVANDAPVGPTTITVDRVLAGDQNGSLLSGTLAIDGTLVVDPNAPLPTATATPTATPTSTDTASPTATRTGTRTVTTTPTASASPSATATVTQSPTPTATETEPPTVTPTGTGTATPTATETRSATPTPTATAPRCTGDCNGDGLVRIAELVTAVRISVGDAPLTQCVAADRNNSGTVTIDELVAAVNNAVAACN